MWTSAVTLGPHRRRRGRGPTLGSAMAVAQVQGFQGPYIGAQAA